jgi:WXG100 family type VII secretion target
MAKISMDPEQAISYGNQIIQNSTTYNNEIKKIYSTVGDLKATWTGSAAQRFTDNIESFKSDYEKFGKLINEFGELLVAIGKDYKNLEENL